MYQQSGIVDKKSGAYESGDHSRRRMNMLDRFTHRQNNELQRQTKTFEREVEKVLKQLKRTRK